MEGQAINSLQARHMAFINELDAFREESSRRELEKCRAEQIREIIQNVPLRFRGKELVDFRVDFSTQHKIKKIVERYIATFTDRLKAGNCLVFCGKPGTGKTMLSLIIYQALAQAGFTVGYEPSLQFLRRLREKEFESDAAFNSQLNMYLQKSFLILDEITEGVGKSCYPADWERKLLLTLINARYERQLCTLAISNMSKQAMLERLGDPTVDRLIENGLFLAFDWHSYRKQQGE